MIPSRNRSRGAALAVAFGMLLAVPALAQDSGQESELSRSIEKALNDMQEHVDSAVLDTKLPVLDRIRVRPSLKESLIWTDNVFMNDQKEDPIRVLTVTNGNRRFYDPANVPGLEARYPDLARLSQQETRGRVDDLIIQSELTLDFETEVNEEKSKLFERKTLKVLGLQVRNQEYMDINELDNTSIMLSSDVFAFISDLFDVKNGNRIWVRTKVDYENIEDPLDIEIPLLQPTRVGSVDEFDEFGRTEVTALLDVGYVHSDQVRGFIGYENYHLVIEDDALEQAAHTRHNIHAEGQTDLQRWGFAEKTGYVRYDYWKYRFHRSEIARPGLIPNPIPGQGPTPYTDDPDTAKILNDADVHRIVFGARGLIFSRRIQGQVELGYLGWDSESNGEVADSSDFREVVGGFKFAYRPHDERETQFQISYNRGATYSAISNFNATHEVEFNATHEFIAKKLDGDFTLSFTRVEPSDGPSRDLYEGGFGLTYHLFKQADLTFRYLIRAQEGSHEIENVAALARKNLLVSYATSSDLVKSCKPCKRMPCAARVCCNWPHWPDQPVQSPRRHWASTSNCPSRRCTSSDSSVCASGLSTTVMVSA